MYTEWVIPGQEGGLNSVIWAGPEDRSGGMQRGEFSVQGKMEGTPPTHLKLGFSGEDFGYAVDMSIVSGAGNEGHRKKSSFVLDPEFKHESIWSGPFLRPANLLVDRKDMQSHFSDRTIEHLIR